MCFSRAVTEERCKSQYRENPNKALKYGLFVALSPSSPPVTNVLSGVEGLPVRTPTLKILAGLDSKGFESKGGFDLEGSVQPKIQDQTSSLKGMSNKEWICQSPLEQLHEGGIAIPPSETNSRKV